MILTQNVKDIIGWAMTDPDEVSNLIMKRDLAVDHATTASALTYVPWNSHDNDDQSLDEFLGLDFETDHSGKLHWSGSDYSGAEVIYIIANTVGTQMAAARSGAPPSVPPPWTT